MSLGITLKTTPLQPCFMYDYLQIDLYNFPVGLLSQEVILKSVSLIFLKAGTNATVLKQFKIYSIV